MEGGMNPEAIRSSDRPQVKPYEPPQVRDLGTLVELTRKNEWSGRRRAWWMHPMSH